MEKQTVISIVLCLLLLVTVLSQFLISPTKAEVDRYFEKNNCPHCAGGPYGQVYEMRRETGILFGQIFTIPSWWILPNFMLYTTTPFNYYQDAELVQSMDNFHTYTWIDTRSGTFVYDALTGEYVKEIESKEDPAIKWHEETVKETEAMQR